jgi:Xaa-Pro aminopeptidase
MDIAVSPVRQRIAAVRDELSRHGAAAVLVPSSDPHLSEYLPERWQARQWLSGFTGSVGTLVVTAHDAALFADSRYWSQAEAQIVGSGIELVRIPTGNSTQYADWLAAAVTPGDTVLVDGLVLGASAARHLRRTLGEAGVTLRTDIDVLAATWPDRPALPRAPVYEHLPPYATEPRRARLALIRKAMRSRSASHHFVSTVDDIAWITNLRGSDVDYNPVFLAHLLIDAQRATLFIDRNKVDAALAERLADDRIDLADYADAPAALAALPAQAALLVDPRRVTLGFQEAVANGVAQIEEINPSTLFKSRKSALDAANVREAMAQDGAAMCEFYAAFEAAQARGDRITELTVDEQLSAARSRRPGFVGLSFSTIAAFNANGAMPHYRALPESHAVIAGDGLLLIDSGGQYLGGTTDITRMWAIGQVSEAQRRDVTLVLRGTMALSRTRFPRGTLSPMLDAIARAPLWENGMDFGHGTGHGVGYFLNVHEGPQSFSRTAPEAAMALEPGMITSIEPGVYRPGQWGVRVENLVLNVAVETPEKGGFGEMLEFETLTLCPIDTRCIVRELLREDEIDWLNRYHATVRERLSALVSGAALTWLIARTEAI